MKVDLEDLERLERQAWPGPWCLSLCPRHERDGGSTSCLTHRTLSGAVVLGDRSDTPNGRLSAALRNAAPALFRELRALRKVRDAAEAWSNIPVSRHIDSAELALVHALEEARKEGA